MNPPAASAAWPRLIYHAAVGVDGYLADPASEPAWRDRVEGGTADFGLAALLDSVDALLLGRRTYQQWLAAGPWPHPGKPAWVPSQQALRSSLPEVRIRGAGLPALLDEIAASGARRVWLVGGGALASSLLSAGAIHELDLRLLPRVLGSGVALFAQGSVARPLALLDSQSHPGGVLRLRYRVG